MQQYAYVRTGGQSGRTYQEDSHDHNVRDAEAPYLLRHVLVVCLRFLLHPSPHFLLHLSPHQLLEVLHLVQRAVEALALVLHSHFLDPPAFQVLSNSRSELAGLCIWLS